jgi:hypothetical protein
VRAGALERGGPRLRGVEPSSEAVPARRPSRPHARRTSLEGVLSPRARQTLLEGHSEVLPWQAAGATRVVVASCMCFRCVS